MLKSLELYGFKSFADRTHFDFAAGLTGVSSQRQRQKQRR